MNWNLQQFRSLFVKSQQPKRPISDANNFVMFYDTKDLIPNDIILAILCCTVRRSILNTSHYTGYM